MNFRNFTDLVKKVNQDLGDFCNEVQYKRKELTKAARISERNKLFVGPEKNRNWAINSGGGTEVQFHINFNSEARTIGYGIGFNAQYVPFANDMVPEDYIKPYTKAFLKLKPKVDRQLDGYSFIHGDIDFMHHPFREGYALYGKECNVKKSGANFEISDEDYQEMLDDIKSQYNPWLEIFTLRNEMVEKEQNNLNLIELLQHKGQIILQGPPGTGKTYMAKDIAYRMIFDEAIGSGNRKKCLEELVESNQFSLIQFHPAYSYEDFVRGISAKANGNVVEYETENRILADFAGKALENFLDSKKDKKQLSKEQWLAEQFEAFVDELSEELAEKEKIKLTPSVDMVSIDPDAFRYGSKWASERRMKFRDILVLYINGIKERRDIKKFPRVSALANSHATYFKAVLDKFYLFMKNKKEPKKASDEVKEKNFVLIIDEINRANLPSVLGELIYALEYRGEPIDSLYAIDGERTIILPPNLYVIGTMNTADRSVGNVDYAIRRRFAFASLLPRVDILKNDQAKSLFQEVSKLFDEDHLAPDFDKKDVQLGHSYFMTKSTEELELNLEYEIKPLLTEYVKDGILLSSALPVIEALSVG